jgi:hypothetical protein
MNNIADFVVMCDADPNLDQQHVGFFVRGLMMDNAIKMAQDPRSESYEIYIGETIALVVAYLQGRKTLDGRCSDLQCHAAIEAKKVFQ